MRLQLIIAAFASATAFTAPGAAQSLARVDARAGAYQDSDRTSVTTTNLAARAESGRWGAEMRYLVDVVSSASVDVVTAATGTIHDVRAEIEGGATYRDDYRRVRASYVHSQERDWESSTGNAALLYDLVGHRVTLHVSGTYVSNHVGRANDPAFRRRMFVGGGTAGASVVLSPRDLVDVSYTLTVVDGYQASPYRFVFFGGPAGTPTSSGAPEVDPEERLRHAATVRYNRHLFRDTALRAHARGYVDSWRVASATLGAEYIVGLGDVDAGPFVRAYAQRHAAFYAPTYAQPMKYMTADRELASFWDVFAGARIAWRHERPLAWIGELRAEAKVSAFYFRFIDFPRLPERSGALGEIAIGVTF